MPYTGPIYFSGVMMATSPTQPIQTPGLNPGDPGFGMIVEDATAIGTGATQHRLVWYQNLNTTAEEFLNGQFWRVETYDPASDPDGDPTVGDDGWTVQFNELVPRQDLVSGVGAGDEYVVFAGPGGTSLIYDLNGPFTGTPTDYTYLGSEQNGDPLVGDNDSNLDFADAYNVCFAQGTMILTDRGEVAIEDLTPGDKVMTRDQGPQEIRWIGRKTLSARILQANDKLRPIRIRAGALAAGTPATDLIVSPQHRILVRSAIAQRLFGTDEVLVAAKHLLEVEGIEIAQDMPEVTYFHFLLNDHHVVVSNGAQTESLYTGSQALKSISPAAREEIFAIFPQLADREATHVPRGARSLLTGRQGRELARHHAATSRALMT